MRRFAVLVLFATLVWGARRWKCRMVSRSASAPCRFVIWPASAAFRSPARGSSFVLIVKVPMRRRHFHVAAAL